MSLNPPKSPGASCPSEAEVSFARQAIPLLFGLFRVSLSQAEAAEAVGLTEEEWAAYEAGRRLPNLPTFLWVCTWFLRGRLLNLQGFRLPPRLDLEVDLAAVEAQACRSIDALAAGAKQAVRKLLHDLNEVP